MSERSWRRVPVGIEEMPAGAALAAVLEGIDPEQVSPFDSVRVVRAWRRQLSQDQSRFSAAVLQCALADPEAPGGRTEVVGPHGADELRSVLCESGWAVDRVLSRAEFAQRWPGLSQAWEDGTIDQERVRVFVRHTGALSEEHTGEVMRIVVPEAGGLTLGKLAERIEQVARDLDPEWAKKTYDRHREQRRVRARRTEAGTANLSGLDLGLDDTALAERNISVLAARAKASGHPGLMDTIEADIYVALLKPRPPWRTDDDLVAAVVAAADPADPRDPAPAPGPDRAPPDGPVPGDTDQAPQDDAEPGAGESDASEPDDGNGDHGPNADETDAPRPVDGDGEPDAAGTTFRRRSRRWPRRSKLALRVGLLTLLGLDRCTARLPGYGIVHAELARRLSQDWADAEWRVAFEDDTGALSAVLTTRRRPDGWTTVPVNPDGTPTDPSTYHPATGTPAGSPAPPRPLVILHVTDAEFDRLDPADLPAWSALLTDLTRQRTSWWRTADQRVARGDPGLDLGVRQDGAPVDLGGLLADLTADRAARFPTAAQRRWLEERNQTCTFPACGADAVYCDIDHTHPAGQGGLTLSGNLGPACPHDNRLKEQPGWWVDQPRPGHFVWHSNTGHAYPSAPTGPVPDHPPPCDVTVVSRSAPLEYADDHGAWTNRPYPAAPAPARPPPDDDPPPF